MTIEKSDALFHVSAVVGWIYFLAWSVSFYPQIYTNYKRKSVVGLNFDYLSLNLVGFFMYGLFNCGLYWIPEIEVRYRPKIFIYVFCNKIKSTLCRNEREKERERTNSKIFL